MLIMVNSLEILTVSVLCSLSALPLPTFTTTTKVTKMKRETNLEAKPSSYKGTKLPLYVLIDTEYLDEISSLFKFQESFISLNELNLCMCCQCC